MFVFDVPIMVFHDITSGVPANDQWRLSVSIQQFERRMRYLCAHGYSCISLIELLQSSGDEQASQRKRIALTFDDGYESFYNLAYPVLKQFNFTATVFLITDRIRESDHQGNGAEAHFLSWRQVKSLYDYGISFGSHTCTHPYLSQVSSAQVSRELVSSKEIIEERLGIMTRLLAYPYGDSNIEVQRMAKIAGYEAGFGIAGGRSSRFNMWRTQCHTNDTRLDLVLQLTRWPYYLRWFREETSMGRFARRVKRAVRR